MAEQGTGQEKTEDATPRRLRDARKKGQVAKSRDLNTVIILIAAFAGLVAFKDLFLDHLRLVMQPAFEIGSQATITNEELFRIGQLSFLEFIKMMTPYLGLVLFVTLFIGFIQVGPVFSAEPLKPQAKRLNIVQNVKNMFKITLLVELVKNILKVLLVFVLGYLTVKSDLGQIVLTVTGTLPQGAAVASHVIWSFLIKVFVCFLVIALIDFGFQRWHYKKELRMTKEEVKREYKQDEGDPLIKSMRRQLHQELAMGDVRKAVAASDAVITNPTEVAVAVQYDDKTMMAPQVNAKGQRLFADAIREMAKEAGIPIIQNVPLAWALLELDIGDEVPEELYAAVAEILVIVYRMKEERGMTV